MSPDIQELRARLAPVLARAPLRLAMLFGSAARGRMRPDRDVDLGIVPVDTGWALEDELRLQGELCLAARREVDLVRLDLADELLRWEVARVGIPLRSEPAWEAPRFVAEAAIAHAELAPAIDQAVRRYRAFLARTA